MEKPKKKFITKWLLRIPTAKATIKHKDYKKYSRKENKKQEKNDE